MYSSNLFIDRIEIFTYCLRKHLSAVCEESTRIASTVNAINTVSVQNLHAIIGCVLVKDTLQRFLLRAVPANRSEFLSHLKIKTKGTRKEFKSDSAIHSITESRSV